MIVEGRQCGCQWPWRLTQVSIRLLAAKVIREFQAPAEATDVSQLIIKFALTVKSQMRLNETGFLSFANIGDWL